MSQFEDVDREVGCISTRRMATSKSEYAEVPNQLMASELEEMCVAFPNAQHSVPALGLNQRRPQNRL